MRIKRISVLNEQIPMCDIEVDEAHCFYYNGVVVHNSNKQKAEALLKVGIDTGKISEKSGQMVLDKDALETLAKKYDKEVKEYNSKPDYYDAQFEAQKHQKGGIKRVPYEVIAWLLERSSLRKQLSSYTEKLSKVSTAFINYKLFDTGTGRLASGGSGNEYFMNLNYQNLTKPKPALYRTIPKGHPYYDSELFKDCDEVLDYKFREVTEFDENGKPLPLLDNDGNPIEGTDYFVEGTKKELNIRSAITVPDKKDWYFCSMDFSMQEAKLLINECISYEGVVKTSEFGEISLNTVKNLLNDGKTVLVETPIGYRKVNKFFDNGKKRLVRVTLGDGTQIECSSNHQFLVKDILEDKYMFLTIDSINKNKHYLITKDDKIDETLLKDLIRGSLEGV